MGFWIKSAGNTNRFTSGGAIALVAVRAVHRNRRAPVSHGPITAQPTANQASQPPPLAPVSRYLAVGVACACCVGSFGRDRDAFTCCLSTTRIGFVHASPSDSHPHASGAAVNHIKGTTRETVSKKPIPRTIPNEKNRSRTMPRNPLDSSGATSQMVFKADRSSQKTPEAPNRRLIKPTTVPNSPAAGFRACKEH